MSQVERATSTGGKQYLTRAISMLQSDSKNINWGLDIDGRKGFYFLGFDLDTPNSTNFANQLELRVEIPENFTVTNAVITFLHIPINWDDGGTYDFVGYCRDIKVYNVTNADEIFVYAAYESEYYAGQTQTLVEVPSAFGVDGYTAGADSVTNYTLEQTDSKDIKEYLIAGENLLVIKTSTSAPAWDATPATNRENIGELTGWAKAIINVTGYVE